MFDEVEVILERISLVDPEGNVTVLALRLTVLEDIPHLTGFEKWFPKDLRLKGGSKEHGVHGKEY